MNVSRQLEFVHEDYFKAQQKKKTDRFYAKVYVCNGVLAYCANVVFYNLIFA